MTMGATRGIVSARVLGLLALVALFAATLGLRSANIWHRPLLSHNEDATGHVLATLQGMHAAPVSVHKYLPIITLSQRPADQNIDNFVGASISDGVGNYFYVSFPPLGFAVPAVLFQMLGMEPSLIMLRLFCAALGLLTTTLLYLLSLRLLRSTSLPARSQALAAFCVASLMLMNSESLWIFGNVYWHHVLLEPLLVWSLLLIAQMLERPTALRGALLVAALLLACCIEWAAFPLAGGVAMLGLYRLVRRQGGGAWQLLAGAVAPVAGLLFIFWHFSQIAGLQAYLDVLQNRATEHGWKHNAAIQAVVALAPIYLPLACLAFFLFRSRRATQDGVDDGAGERGVFRGVLFCAAAGAAESVILLKHTAKYTYGSLPLTTFLLLALLGLLVWTRASVRRFAWGTAVCAIAWLGIYFVQNPPGLQKTEFGRQFDNIAEMTRRAGPDEMVFTNLYAPLGVPLALAGRNLASPPNLALGVPLVQMQAFLAQSRAARGKLFLYDLTLKPIDQWVWWPYTKSRVVGRPERYYGSLAAVVSFDRSGITAITVRKDASSRRIFNDWWAKQPLLR